ncbi:TOX high mobility group box family member 3-like [Ptychodera flava]|uniref:TOX high mobility group box family member 3-like n=1 Tax=Ptychodera flava TaxID=63121 RepID=UPI00396A8BB7
MQHLQQQQRSLQQQQYYASQQTQAMQGRPRGNTNRKVKRPGFASRATAVFGIFQFIFGGICVILGITAIVIKCQLSKSGTGIWCGVMFAVTGLFGIEASLKKTNALIITTMVLSIISATVAGSACIIGIIGALIEEQCYYVPHFDHDGNQLRNCDTNYGGRVAVDSILVIVALAELVTAVLQSVFCCRAYCCNQKPSSSMMYIAVRTSEGAGQGSPMGVIQSEPAQQMAPSGVEVVPHYPNWPQEGYDVNMQPVVTSNQQPGFQLEPLPGFVYQQGQGHQLPQQQHQLQQRQQMLQLHSQQLQHQVLQPEVVYQRPQGWQLPQQHRQQVPQLQPQQLQYQPQQILRPETVDQQQLLQGWHEAQPKPKQGSGPPKQHDGKVTGPDVNVNQDQVQSPPTNCSVREDMSAGLVENEVPLA